MNMIITLTAQRGASPVSTHSTNRLISVPNTDISLVTLIGDPRAHRGGSIPQHDWVRDGWGLTTVNLYEDKPFHKKRLHAWQMKGGLDLRCFFFTFAQNVRLCPVTIIRAHWHIDSPTLIKPYMANVSYCAPNGGAAVPQLPSVRHRRRVATQNL